MPIVPPLDYVMRALDNCRGKLKLFTELPAYAGFYFKEAIELTPAAVEKEFVPAARPRLEVPRPNSPAYPARCPQSFCRPVGK